MLLNHRAHPCVNGSILMIASSEDRRGDRVRISVARTRPARVTDSGRDRPTGGRRRGGRHAAAWDRRLRPATGTGPRGSPAPGPALAARRYALTTLRPVHPNTHTRP